MTTDNKLTKRDENLPETTRDELHLSPAVDIYENDDEILLLADMPGVAKDDLLVHVEKEVLKFEGKKGVDSEGLLNCEAQGCIYTRSFSLPKTIDSDKISASLDRGVLTLRLPKREAVKPRQIQVTAG